MGGDEGWVQDRDVYLRDDLAGTHHSDAGSQPRVDSATLETLLARVQRDGFVVLPDLLSPEQLQAIRDDVEPHLTHTGRNPFEGLRTQRIYAVLRRTRTCDALVEHPLVLGLLDRLLMPNYLLSQLQVIRILPGEAAQPLHHDDAFYPFPRPRSTPLAAATIVAIDDFTEDNGATRVIPGSHLWDSAHPVDASDAQPVVMNAGSGIFFLGTLWHSGGENRSDAPRSCVTAQYCQPFLRTQENFFLSVPRHRAASSSKHVQRLLGYSVHAPFMGFVDGMHPKRALDPE